MTSDSKAKHYKRLADMVRQAAFSEYIPNPATDADIQAAEQQLNCTFPESFKWFQKEFGAYSGFTDVYGVKPLPAPRQNIVGITMQERHECYPPMPSHLIPSSDDSGGDSYCFDTSRFVNGECPVVFWDHEADEKQIPEQWAINFSAWLEEELAD
jgi:cell wall assembly regulator SMI1